MREILFRGRRMDNDEWVEGYFYQSCTGACGIARQNAETGLLRVNYIVDPATVGQYTGKEASHKTKVFDGDILEDAYGMRWVVEWLESECGFACKDSDGDTYWNTVDLLSDDGEWIAAKVIGNIHDTPWLVGGQEND